MSTTDITTAEVVDDLSALEALTAETPEVPDDLSALDALTDPAPIEWPTVAVADLIAHPGNARSEIKFKRGFLASIKAEGIRVPLLITKDPDNPGLYRVFDGMVRLYAAQKLGIERVPYTFDAARADDEAGQYLDMILTSKYKTPLTEVEEADALFRAKEAGASKERLTKAYGSTKRVNAALKVAAMPTDTRSAALATGYEWSLDELVALDEFATDAEATARLIEASGDEHSSFGYQIARERIDRAEAAKRQELRDRITAGGVTLLEDFQSPTMRLNQLRTQDGERIEPADHVGCPGHAAVLENWRSEEFYVCTAPAANGHRPYWESSTATSAASVSQGDAEAESEAKRNKMRAVKRGNKDHDAAEIARAEWLTELFSRTSFSREHADLITRFTALTYLTAPEPIRKAMGNYRANERQAELLGVTVPDSDGAAWSRVGVAEEKNKTWSGAVESAGQRRLMMLTFAPIAAAYEKAFARDVWRLGHNRYDLDQSRRDTRAWLELCQQLGHRLSPIERAIADDVTYIPDVPGVADVDLSDDEDEFAAEAQDRADQGEEQDGDVAQEDPAAEEPQDSQEPGHDDQDEAEDEAEQADHGAAQADDPAED